MQTKEIHLWSQTSFPLMVSQVPSSHYLIRFEANVINDCVYHKFSGRKYIFLVLYVDDILLVSSVTGLLHETKRFMMKNFKMKDLGEASFVLGIQILRDRSQENYISKVLERFDMKDSKLRETLIAKADKFSFKQCPNNDLKRNEMQKILYASAMGSLMYAQVCTRPDIAFVVGVLGSQTHDALLKENKRTHAIESLKIWRSSGCQDRKCSTSRYIYMLAGGDIS
ncbi:hypothetical protein CR513_23584, partial [Mucuna pruriens]